MTAQRNQPGKPRKGNAAVVSITARSPGGYKRQAARMLASARAALGMTHAEFARYLGDRLGWYPEAATVERYQENGAVAAEVLLAAVSDVRDGVSRLLDVVPQSFPAEVIEGQWLTCYQFTHSGKPMVHADVATITAESDRRIRAVNHPPEPRTEGRANPFRNEIEAELASRHLVGCWKNTSDARYFGSLHLAVLPGESAMDGYYTGFGSDVEVSTGPWKWVRLNADANDLNGLILRDPKDLMDMVTSRSPADRLLTVGDIREEN